MRDYTGVIYGCQIEEAERMLKEEKEQAQKPISEYIEEGYRVKKAGWF